MKFGKQLEISANDEWRDHYVQYKRLKRLIKRVAFEVEKKDRKTEKLQQQLAAGGSPGLARRVVGGGGSPPDADVQLRVVDETHPLLQHVVDEVQDAKDQFWEVTNANLKIVNDFYTGKMVSMLKSIHTFEATVADEENSRGHVHSRSRTLSQGTSCCSVLLFGGVARDGWHHGCLLARGRVGPWRTVLPQTPLRGESRAPLRTDASIF
jgi:phosphate transporter